MNNCFFTPAVGHSGNQQLQGQSQHGSECFKFKRPTSAGHDAVATIGEGPEGKDYTLEEARCRCRCSSYWSVAARNGRTCRSFEIF